MRETVEEYYGKVLTSSSDLKTNACTTSCAPSSDIKALLKNIHNEVSSRYYGCGLVYPPLLEGLRILDLGCGSGQDCYVLAQMVGERGEVVGVDMTDEQLDVARRHVDWHTQAFGYSRPNVRFLKGYIEKLDQLDLEPGSFDVIVSNCVINLSIDKAAVLREAAKLLREGGEMYFSDVYADRRVPQHLVNDPVLYGECLSGAMYWNDFHNLAREVGFDGHGAALSIGERRQASRDGASRIDDIPRRRVVRPRVRPGAQVAEEAPVDPFVEDEHEADTDLRLLHPVDDEVPPKAAAVQLGARRGGHPGQ